MFFVSVPFGEGKTHQELWKEIDEQHFPPPLRQKLSQNGFRVGMVGGQIPVPLAQLMQLNDKPAPAGETEASEAESLGSTPRVLRRHLQARKGRRNEVIASGIYDELPVLRCESGTVGGRTYLKAQGIFALTVWPESDGRVKLELVPELHHGDPGQRWIASDGALRMEAGRDRLAFADLSISATLSPGHMVLLSSLPGRSGSIGHSFFTLTNGGSLEQKLLVIRVAQTQHDATFAPGQPLPLDEIE